MTREEAIDYLKWVRPKKPYTLDKKNVQTAIDMAIEALKEQRPHGEWEYDDRSGQFICSECEGGVNMPTLMGEPLYKWCPWCGADMRKESDPE